jgi:hypothetical protein
MANVLIFSETFKTFLREKSETSKVCKSLYLYSQNYKLKSYELMINPNEVNYITFRNNGLISYLPKGKEHLENESGTWKKENRQEGKPAKVIRKLFTDKAVKLFKDSDLDCFNNIYKTYFNTELTFEMLLSDEIPNVYCMTRKSGGGSLNSSCMNDDRNYLDIYANCKSLRILVLKDKQGLLCGRALIWFVDGVYIMDRVYVSDDYMFEMFFDYATKHDFIRKAVQSYSDKTTWINSDGQKFEKYFKIYTDTDFSEYPYIDTFSYGNDGFLSNQNSFDYTYNNTDGNRDGDNSNDYDEHDGEIWDEIDEQYIDEDDAVCINYGRYRNCYTHIDNTKTTIDGNVYWNQSDLIVRLENGDITELDNATYCEYNEEYYLSDDCYLVNNGEYSDKYVHEDSLVTDINGETWIYNDDDITEINGDYYPIDSELITCIDAEYCLIQELGNVA